MYSRRLHASASSAVGLRSASSIADSIARWKKENQPAVARISENSAYVNKPAKPVRSASDVYLLPTASLKPSITMTICGETITCNLEDLDEDPSAIIHLLKETTSERGNWIMVSVFYRRAGNSRAALKVLTTMLEVMVQHGMHDTDLKPAYLMLSGCETDLAKLAGLSGLESDAHEHYMNSRDWLQKVYGNDIPTTPHTTSEILVSSTNRSFASNSASSSIRPPSTILVSVPSESSRCLLLEREIQSWRDRDEEHATVLAETHYSKRRIEEDLSYERTQRRKLEKEVESLQQDLDMAKRMEQYALDQIRWEVENRRKADGRAEEEKQRRLQAEQACEKMAVRPLFENLANIFQRAAGGGDFNSRIALGGTHFVDNA